MSRQHQSLDPRRWRHVRRCILNRDGWRCCECGRYANQVDHVQPLDRSGDPYALGNLQALCRGCHIRKTAFENRRELTPGELAWQEFVDELAGPKRPNWPF